MCTRIQIRRNKCVTMVQSLHTMRNRTRVRRFLRFWLAPYHVGCVFKINGLTAVESVLDSEWRAHFIEIQLYWQTHYKI